MPTTFCCNDPQGVLMTVMRWIVSIAAVTLLLNDAAFAQQPAAPQPAAPRPARDPDRDINFNQPDFTVITLPTTLPLPRHKSAFRVTHRFGRPLNQGRFWRSRRRPLRTRLGCHHRARVSLRPIRNLQAGIYRTSGKTIEFFGEYNVVRQSASRPFGLAAVARSMERTTSAIAIRPRWARWSRASLAARRRLLRADLGQQQQPAANGTG
jgi:hypothetical protein